MGLFCILSPLAVNRVGVRTTLVLGTLGWPVYSAALYQNNRYGTEWFVILGAAVCGLSAGLYWAAEGAIVLSYPPHARRGRYLALWLAFKNAGQLIGGAINLGLNARRATGGKISYVTIIVFIALQVLAFPTSFALSPPEKTVRPDGTRIVVEERTSARHQLKMLWKVATTRRIGLLLPIFFASWFYWGYASTYLTLYFTVRARALASFLSAVTGSLAGVLFGFFLDSQKLSIKVSIENTLQKKEPALETISLLLTATIFFHRFGNRLAFASASSFPAAYSQPCGSGFSLSSTASSSSDPTTSTGPRLASAAPLAYTSCSRRLATWCRIISTSLSAPSVTELWS